MVVRARSPVSRRLTAALAVAGVLGLALSRSRRREHRLIDEYPSLDLAYDYVRPSYDLLSRRLDAVENRGRAVLTFASTLTFAMPLLAANLLGSGLFEEQLDIEPDQFKVNQLSYAADDFVTNTRLITRLARTTSLAAILLLIEAAAFGMWILNGA